MPSAAVPVQLTLLISLFLLFEHSNGKPAGERLIFAGKQIKNSPKLPEPIFDPEEVALNQRILVALDSDKDGQVSFKEFVFGYQAGLRCHGFGDNLLPLFTKTDLNGDKTLSLEEISAPTDLLYNVTSLDSTTVKENFEVTDKNKDGQISFVEVSEDMLEKYMVSQMANMIKRFQLMDSNGDQKLVLNELNAYPKKINMDKEALADVAEFMSKRC